MLPVDLYILLVFSSEMEQDDLRYEFATEFLQVLYCCCFVSCFLWLRACRETLEFFLSY